MKAVVTEKRKSRFVAFLQENFEALKVALSNENDVNEEITDVELLKSLERVDKIEKKYWEESIKVASKKSNIKRVNVSGKTKTKYEPAKVKTEYEEKERD